MPSRSSNIDMFYGDFGGNLDGLIESVIDTYEEERDQFWIDDEQWAEIDEQAEAMFSASGELQSTVEIRKLAAAIRGDLERKDFKYYETEQVVDRLQIEIAKLFSTGIRERVKRCLELCVFAPQTQPTEATSRFLKRLSRCYICGFLPECMILCRSVLDKALNDCFDRHCIPIPATEEGRSELITKIRAAGAFNWLSWESLNAADTIRLRANKAVHDDPEVTKDARDVRWNVLMTLQIANELSTCP